MNLVIDVDTRELRRAFAKAPLVVGTKLNAWIHTTTLRTERSAKQHVPPSVDTGQLQSSIHSRFGHLRGEVKPTVKHAIFVHEGRRPGRMPPFQPGTALNSWATRKGMNPFLVARSIGRKGTKKNPYMDEAYQDVKPWANRHANDVLDDIVRAI